MYNTPKKSLAHIPKVPASVLLGTTAKTEHLRSVETPSLPGQVAEYGGDRPEERGFRVPSKEHWNPWTVAGLIAGPVSMSATGQ